MNANRRARRTCLFWSAAVVVAFGGGCATTHEVVVESVNHPAADGAQAQSYRLVTRSGVHDERSLRYKEAAAHVRTALSGHGLYEAPAGAPADMVVEIDYGIEQPRMRYRTVSEPVYVEQPSSFSRTTTPPRTVIGRPPRNQDPQADEPKLALIGYADVPRPYFTREKYLTVTARPDRTAPDEKPAAELWHVNVSIEDESDDVRRYLPVLAGAVMNQLGDTTEGTIVARIGEHDAGTDFIRRGL